MIRVLDLRRARLSVRNDLLPGRGDLHVLGRRGDVVIEASHVAADVAGLPGGVLEPENLEPDERLKVDDVGEVSEVGEELLLLGQGRDQAVRLHDARRVRAASAVVVDVVDVGRHGVPPGLGISGAEWPVDHEVAAVGLIAFPFGRRARGRGGETALGVVGAADRQDPLLAKVRADGDVTFLCVEEVVSEVAGEAHGIARSGTAGVGGRAEPVGNPSAEFEVIVGHIALDLESEVSAGVALQARGLEERPRAAV